MRKYSGLRADIREMQPALHCAENGEAQLQGILETFPHLAQLILRSKKDAGPSVWPTLRRRGETRWRNLEGGELDLYICVGDYSFFRE